MVHNGDDYPPGGMAWLDNHEVKHGILWRAGEWLLAPGNLEVVMLSVVVAASALLMAGMWLVGGQQ